MQSKAHSLNGGRLHKATHDITRNRMTTEKTVYRAMPAVSRDEKLDVEAALSPFWAWRITSH
jgi:hypothetical protein